MGSGSSTEGEGSGSQVPRGFFEDEAEVSGDDASDVSDNGASILKAFMDDADDTAGRDNDKEDEEEEQAYVKKMRLLYKTPYQDTPYGPVTIEIAELIAAPIAATRNQDEEEPLQVRRRLNQKKTLSGIHALAVQRPVPKRPAYTHWCHGRDSVHEHIDGIFASDGSLGPARYKHNLQCPWCSDELMQKALSTKIGKGTLTRQLRRWHAQGSAAYENHFPAASLRICRQMSASP